MPTDPARVQAVFLAAAELADPAQRATCLDRECAGDAALRTRVEALLRAVDQPDSILDAPIIPADGSETKTLAPDPSATQTNADGAADDVADALAFLAPPGRPNSLGRLGHYEVLEVLGRGGFGIVYRAFDDVLQRVVAVKVLAPSMAVTSPARKRFLREAQSAAKIQHENVVRIIEIGEQPLPYLVMEFIAGETLQQRLDRTGPLDVPEVLRIGRQIAAGLAAAHATGLVHRDIKPSNILIGGPGEQVKITDFGLARAADDASLTRSGTVAGTPMYMAPEQARGETLDHRADLFSLGSVVYAMLTGHPPFRASGTLAVLKRVAEDDPRPMREVIPEVPNWLCRIVDKLHAKDPAARYQNAREVADVLADCEAQLAAHGALKDFSRIPGGRPSRRRIGRGWVWASAAAGLLAIVILAAIAIGRPTWLYLSNQGELELVPQDGLVSIIVLQNDEGVLDDNKMHPLVTDWLGMKTGHTLKLPPGKYQLNAGLAPPGPNIVHWEVTTSGTFSSSRRLVPGFGHVGWTVIVTVGRGERVSVRPVLGQVPPSSPAGARTPPGQELVGWGRAVDPQGDCRFEPEGDRLLITVPSGHHGLNPTGPFRNYAAPRVLKKARGDFDLQVKVLPFERPKPGSASNGGISYVAAGLVVWQDPDNFVRWVRAANGESGRLIASLEVFRQGHYLMQEGMDVPNGPTVLRIERRDGRLRCTFSADGSTWHEAPAADADWGGEVDVGVAAMNTTTGTHVARLERFGVKELRASPGDVPRRAADVPPFWVGNWKMAAPPTDPKLQPDSYTTFDLVAGGKFLRQRGMRHAIFGYDAEKGILRQWAAAATAPDGPTWGPATGLFNPTNRTVTWTARWGEGNEVTHQMDPVDANTVDIRLFLRDAEDNIAQNTPVRLIRVDGPVPLPSWPIDAKRPAEMKILDRLVGDWETTSTMRVTQNAPGGGITSSNVGFTSKVESRDILAGRFIETITTAPDGHGDYSLMWFDPAAKKYRQWYFRSDGQVADLTGAWEEKTQSLVWLAEGSQWERRFVFKTDDRYEFQCDERDKQGKTISGTTGVARRAASESFVRLFNSKDLTGWQGLPGLWRVAGDDVIGSTNKPGGVEANTFLVSQKTYKDFELRYQVQLKGEQGNTGLQVRSRLVDGKRFVVHGPQVDIGRGVWSYLYEEGSPGRLLARAPADVVARTIRPLGFNDFYVRCVGKHLTVKFNGETTIDGDFPEIPDDGVLALQLHRGTPIEATFRKMEIRELAGK